MTKVLHTYKQRRYTIRTLNIFRTFMTIPSMILRTRFDNGTVYREAMIEVCIPTNPISNSHW